MSFFYTPIPPTNFEILQNYAIIPMNGVIVEEVYTSYPPCSWQIDDTVSPHVWDGNTPSHSWIKHNYLGNRLYGVGGNTTMNIPILPGVEHVCYKVVGEDDFKEIRIADLYFEGGGREIILGGFTDLQSKNDYTSGNVKIREPPFPTGVIYENTIISPGYANVIDVTADISGELVIEWRRSDVADCNTSVPSIDRPGATANFHVKITFTHNGNSFPIVPSINPTFGSSSTWTKIMNQTAFNGDCVLASGASFDFDPFYRTIQHQVQASDEITVKIEVLDRTGQRTGLNAPIVNSWGNSADEIIYTQVTIDRLNIALK